MTAPTSTDSTATESAGMSPYRSTPCEKPIPAESTALPPSIHPNTPVRNLIRMIDFTPAVRTVRGGPLKLFSFWKWMPRDWMHSTR